MSCINLIQVINYREFPIVDKGFLTEDINNRRVVSIKI